MKSHFFLMHVSAALSFLLASCAEPNTLYAKGFNEEKFKKINLGESVDNIISNLGRPLRIEKVSLNPPHRAELMDATKNVEFDPRPEHCYILSYSLQMDGKRDFKRYSLRIERNNVSSKLMEHVTE